MSHGSWGEWMGWGDEASSVMPLTSISKSFTSSAHGHNPGSRSP